MTTLAFKPKLLSTLRHYNKQQFTTDLLAGIIVGIVALPLAIAFGIASGVTPEKGIITAIVAGLIGHLSPSYNYSMPLRPPQPQSPFV